MINPISGGASTLGFINNLNKNNHLASSAMQKIASGFKINKASDSPTGLVISELLRSQMYGTQRAMQNNQEANNMLGIAEGGMSNISNMLTKAKSLAIGSMNTGVTSSGQVSANQAELNGILNSIQNIAGTTRYSSRNLLNGNSQITGSETPQNGATAMLNLTQSRFTAANAPTMDITFNGAATSQAEKANLQTNTGGNANTQEIQRFAITGNNGTQTFAFAAGTSMQQLADVINQSSSQTGVTAYGINLDANGNATNIRLISQEYGSNQTVAVNQEQGNLFAAAGNTVRDAGQDLTVNVNGQNLKGNGLNVTVGGGNFSGTLQFNDTVAQTNYAADNLTNATAKSSTVGNFTGGMQFQLGENAGNTDRFGLPDMSLNNLGRVTVGDKTYSMADLFSGGSASLANNPEIAAKVITQAISDVSGARANVGAYQANTLQTNANSLAVAMENITATESNIRNTDIAQAVTEQTKAMILSKTGIFSIQQANKDSSYYLQLLGGK